MPKKIKLYQQGDCVQVSTWGGCDKDGFFHNEQAVGLVLEAEYVEMDDKETNHEWMYRIILPSGIVTEAWDYEIRPVNILGKKYNTISHQPKGD